MTVALGALPACGGSHPDKPGDPAVWEIAPGQTVDAHTRALMVIVSRTGCSGGEQGRPVTPHVALGDEAVVVTFRIEPHISGGTCQGTAGVPYRLTLPEPLGTRDLVDGACLAGDGLSTTGFCLNGGVRSGH